VTRWSAPDAVTGAKWPSEAELEVGWKGISEQFTSRIYCVPGKVVEALGGSTETALPRNDIKHHFVGGQKERPNARAESVLSHLSTKWTVKDAIGGRQGEETDVHLAIEFQFANPIYSAMSSAVADRVAGYMIEAFEGRVKEVLGKGKR
jgi:coenzyme Q-binding protein COQ10